MMTSMNIANETVCPGCGLAMPKRLEATGHEYINASPECWSVYTEVLEAEYSNPLLFAQVHQLTVDTYAAQHPGGKHLNGEAHDSSCKLIHHHQNPISSQYCRLASK